MSARLFRWLTGSEKPNVPKKVAKCTHRYDAFAVAMLRQTHPDWETKARCENCGCWLVFDGSGEMRVETS